MYPQQYIEYLIHFHGSRDYFECHELLEEYWKETDKGNKNSVYVALILLAVSAYHHRRGNFPGAIRTLEKSLSIFQQTKPDTARLGLDEQDLEKLLDSKMQDLRAETPYKSFNLPISDERLLNTCKMESIRMGYIWLKESDMANEDILNRHSSRDRSEVINDRLKALKLKRN
ncbi:DUF309 domain-containing protein [Mesobacillus harenae]|uniref:DUF309 domain-containing protein n=1 Tax=Mesobacillus harenae TaxID=2213203 RepID=UPI00157FFE0D|nr:DUF309 domain-containing protein [Mesobacillus harenae]